MLEAVEAGAGVGVGLPALHLPFGDAEAFGEVALGRSSWSALLGGR